MLKDHIKNGLLTLMVCTMMFLLGCNDDEAPAVPAPVAGFSFTIDEETGGIVTFTNTSENAVAYLWSFGDGATSTQTSPVKTYTEDGTYEVTLAATNDAGETDTNMQNVTIELIVEMTDEEAPVITLVGDADITLEIGDAYEDAGATANDNVDGDITDSIVVTGEVNTLNAGVYTLTYDVSDAAGNAATSVSRTVTVTFDSGLVTNGDFEGDVADPWFVNFGDPAVVPLDENGGNTYFIVNVENADANAAFTVNLSQVIPMAEGNKYELSFNASSDVNRTIIAGIGLNEDPWTNTTETVSLTTEEQRFTYEFTANFGSTNSRVLFDLAGETGVVVIDNVSLILTEEAPQPMAALPLDFETDDDVFGVFNGASFEIAADPDNAENNVGKITNVGAEFEGISLQLGTPVDFSTDKRIIMDFYTSTADIPVLLKFEGGTDGAATEVVATATSTGWQELAFDFTTDDTFSTIVLFVDGPGFTTGEFFIDDITQVAGGGGGSSSGCDGDLVPATMLPVDFEGCESFLSTFANDGSLTVAIEENPSKTGVNTSDYALKVVKAAGTNKWAGFQNTFPEGTFDYTDQVLKLRVYSSKANVVFRFEMALDPQTDPVTGNPAPVFATVENANEWTDVEVAFSNFPATPSTYNQLVIKPDNADGTDGELTDVEATYFIDDIRLDAASANEIDYCGSTFQHLNIEAEVASAINLTIEKTGDLAMTVTITSANDDVVDFLEVNSITDFAGAVATQDVTDGSMSVTINWTDTAPTDVSMNILWSKESTEGNWLLEAVTLPFDSTCE